MNNNIYQGSKIAYLRDTPGIYAWYYKPLSINDEEMQNILESLINQDSRLSASVKLRYGITLSSSADLIIRHGSKGMTTRGVVKGLINESKDLIKDFLMNDVSYLFMKPIYIGIAKDLNYRVYKQHYSKLIEYWDDSSRVSRLLSTDEEFRVQEVMERLELPHSFALEARVRKIAPKDLSVHVFETENMPTDIEDLDDAYEENENSSRRKLERLLQLMSDPVCGRR